MMNSSFRTLKDYFSSFTLFVDSGVYTILADKFVKPKWYHHCLLIFFEGEQVKIFICLT